MFLLIQGIAKADFIKGVSTVIYEQSIPDYESSPNIKKTIVAERREKSPIIDGKMGDNFWAGIQKFTGFTLYPSYTEVVPYQTEVWIGYTQESLYIFLKAYTKSSEEMKYAKEGKRDLDIWAGEFIEIFLIPGDNQSNYYQFVVNPGGLIFDGQGHNSDWDGEWNYVSSIEKDFWTAEISIPFKTLNRKIPEVNELWGIHIFRTDSISVKSWLTPLFPSTSNHTPDRFGHLLFIDSSISMEYAVLTDIFIPDKAYFDINKLWVKIKNYKEEKEVKVLFYIEGEKVREDLYTLKFDEEVIKEFLIPIYRKGEIKLKVELISCVSGRKLSTLEKEIKVSSLIKKTKEVYFIEEKEMELSININKVSSADIVKFILKDAKGNILRSQKEQLRGNFIKLDIGNLKEGIYRLQVDLTIANRQFSEVIEFKKEKGPFDF